MGGTRSAEAVSDWRRRNKQRLVDVFGGKCLDCQLVFPPFMLDFDHRDPSIKVKGIISTTASYARQLEEAQKCDLLCANCHRMRTHRQRCKGCNHCNDK